MGRQNMKKIRIAVIGAGASGLFAAVCAAKRGALVTVFEHGKEAGRKLLMTGNGKCNFTNRRMGAEYYHTSSPGGDTIIASVLKAFSEKDAEAFFEGIGMLVQERDGYLYPASGQAKTVRDVLLRECRRLGVHIVWDTDVYAGIRKEENGLFTVNGRTFDRLILACGGKSERQTGSDGSGYEIAKKFGHTVRELFPALVPLHTDEPDFAGMAGVRVRARLELWIDGKKEAAESGELQLTAQGISGIPVFQLSSRAVCALRAQRKAEVRIDYTNGRNRPEICEMIRAMLERAGISSRSGKRADITADPAYGEALTGLANEKILHYLLRRLQGVSEKELPERLTELLCAHRITVSGYPDLRHAQVTGGGISLQEVSERLESALCGGLFFAGEMLDVDGICGGYNLQWAWSSAYTAAAGAVEGFGYDSDRSDKVCAGKSNA